MDAGLGTSSAGMGSRGDWRPRTDPIRPAPGNVEGSASGLIHAADPAQFDYVYGRSAKRMLGRGWAKETGLYSHRLASCIARAGEIVALELGCRADELEERHRETRASLDQEARGRFDTFWLLLPRVPPGVYYLSFLSVAEPLRGQGLGTRLLTLAVQRARRQGCWAMQIHAAGGSDCIGLYRRLGFRPVCRTTLTEFPRLDANLRLHLDLAA